MHCNENIYLIVKLYTVAFGSYNSKSIRTLLLVLKPSRTLMFTELDSNVQGIRECIQIRKSLSNEMLDLYNIWYRSLILVIDIDIDFIPN